MDQQVQLSVSAELVGSNEIIRSTFKFMGRWHYWRKNHFYNEARNTKRSENELVRSFVQKDLQEIFFSNNGTKNE
jgi:hypothetical protein